MININIKRRLDRHLDTHMVFLENHSKNLNYIHRVIGEIVNNCDTKPQPVTISFENSYRTFYNYWMNSAKRKASVNNQNIYEIDMKALDLVNAIRKNAYKLSTKSLDMLEAVMLYVLRNDTTGKVRSYLTKLTEIKKMEEEYANIFANCTYSMPKELWIKVVFFKFI